MHYSLFVTLVPALALAGAWHVSNLRFRDSSDQHWKEKYDVFSSQLQIRYLLPYLIEGSLASLYAKRTIYSFL